MACGLIIDRAIPAGYMEVGETVQDGAAREAREEANATVKAGSLLTMYDVPRIGQVSTHSHNVCMSLLECRHLTASVCNSCQVHMFYRAKLLSDDVSAGEETLDVALVDLDKIPWDELAFPTVRHTLSFFLKTGRHSPDAIEFKSITEQLI
jgi:ADP-ribose pyrophosphatase YjhB (NUDIX family)